MIFDYQGEVLEIASIDENGMVSTASANEIAQRLSKFNNFGLSPSDLLSASVYKYIFFFLYTVFAMVLIFGVFWAVMFVCRCLPYIHNTHVGLPIYVRKPDGEIVEALFRPLVWCDLRCLMLLQKFTFMFEKKNPQATPAPPTSSSSFRRGMGQGLSHGDK